MGAPEAITTLPALFERAVLCCVPLVDAKRRRVGLRFSAHAPGHGSYALSEFAASLAGVIEELGLPVLISAPGASLDSGLQLLALPPNATLEFDSTLAAHPNAAPLLRTLNGNGVRLALRGRPGRPVPADVLPLFSCAVVPQDDDRRFGETGAPNERRRVPFYTKSVRNLADARAAFARGAQACVGWPFEDKTQVRPRGAQPAQLAVLELMRLLRDEAPPSQLEAALKRDTTLAFKLLALVNSPAMGVSTQIHSIQQAVLMLGYKRLQRWLTLMLAAGNRDPDAAPLVSYSIARGLLLDNLATEVPPELREDMFLTGAFSLLDRLTGLPFDTLFDSALVSQNTVDALTVGTGPLSPLLQLARAVESADHVRVRARLDMLRIPVMTYNQAVLRAVLAGNALNASL